MKNATKLWISVGVLLVFNVFLVFANTTKNRELHKLNNTSQQKDTSVSTNKPLRIDASLLSEKSSPVHLVAMFPNSYCSICLDMELPWLQKIAKKYPSAITILDNGMEYNLASMIGEKVDVEKISDIHKVAAWNPGQIDVPILFITDRAGMIQMQYVNDYKHPEKTPHFYQHVSSLFASVFNK